MRLTMDETPLYVILMVTNKCNLNCKHCYVATEFESSKELPFIQIQDILRKLVEAGTQAICLTGGEPLLRRDFSDILRLLCDMGIKVDVMTNGLLINSYLSVFSRLKDHLTIQISIDGARKETHEFLRGVGTYEKTLYSISKLIENNINCELVYTLS